MNEIISFDDHLKITSAMPEIEPERIEELQSEDKIFIPETIEEEMKASIIVRLAKKLTLSDLECIEREWGTAEYDPNSNEKHK